MMNLFFVDLLRFFVNIKLQLYFFLNFKKKFVGLCFMEVGMGNCRLINILSIVKRNKQDNFREDRFIEDRLQEKIGRLFWN